jgi:hypothetical protein
MRTGSGPEATVYCFSFQLGMWLTEIGLLYDWPNKTVILLSKMPHPVRSRKKVVASKPGRACRLGVGKALADASLRRDHE